MIGLFSAISKCVAKVSSLKGICRRIHSFTLARNRSLVTCVAKPILDLVDLRSIKEHIQVKNPSNAESAEKLSPKTVISRPTCASTLAKSLFVANSEAVVALSRPKGT